MIARATGLDALAARLRKQAAALVEARLAVARVRPDQRWRRAALLWPLFTKG